jgi:hypothetical protein
MQKEMPVPAGTIEMFNSSSLTYSFASASGQSIVPSGTGHYLCTSTQHFVLGYFH